MSKIHILVSGHGSFATGIKGALKLLAKVPSNWSFINFTAEMSDENLKQKFEEVVNKSDSEVLIFTDLVGGTPFKVAATLAARNSRIAVVSGCNLGSLLEVLFKKYSNVADLATDLVAISKRGTQILDLTDLSSKSFSSSNSSDGI